MKNELNLVLSPEEAANESVIRSIAAQQLHISESNITFIKILKRSIDARSRNIKINLKIEIYINENIPESPDYKLTYSNVSLKTPVIIIGAGPAGLFAALRLIELGIKAGLQGPAQIMRQAFCGAPVQAGCLLEGIAVKWQDRVDLAALPQIFAAEIFHPGDALRLGVVVDLHDPGTTVVQHFRSRKKRRIVGAFVRVNHNDRRLRTNPAKRGRPVVITVGSAFHDEVQPHHGIGPAGHVAA